MKNNDVMIAEIRVEGMMCSHCKTNVEKAALSVDGVETAIADLTKGTLTATGKNFDVDKLKTSISDAGYKIID